MNETQSLIFSLLIGINLQLACGNNRAFAPFEPKEDSFIKVGTGSGSRYRGNKDFFLSSLNDPLAPYLLHTHTLELTLRPPLRGKLGEMGGKGESDSSNHRVRSWCDDTDFFCVLSGPGTCRHHFFVCSQPGVPPLIQCVCLWRMCLKNSYKSHFLFCWCSWQCRRKLFASGVESETDQGSSHFGFSIRCPLCMASSSNLGLPVSR